MPVVTRFLCVGDLHLGAGADYGRGPGDRLRDQERVWARALELAADNDVDAVLFAGDAFHHRRPTPAELIAFQRPLMAFLAETKIEVCAIAGNHDCEAADLPSALDVFAPIIDVHTTPALWQTRDATVACLPWAPVSRLVADRGGGDRDTLSQEAAGLLIAAARGLRAQVPTGRPAVLLLHWSISGASTPTGIATDEFREPVIDVDALGQLGFDAVVAGHIHKPQELLPFRSHNYFYVGSPLPIDFGEASSPHGCYLLELGEGDGHETTFLPIESRSFVTVDVDLTTLPDGSHPNTAHNTIVDELEARDLTRAVVRIRYRATEEQARHVDQPALRHVAAEDGAHKVYAIQPEIIREQRGRVAGVDETLGPLEALDQWLGTLNELDGLGDEVRDLTRGYLEEVQA